MMHARLDPARTTRTAVLLLVAGLAALVRCWGIGFGLPHTDCRPDEQVIVGLASQFWDGDMNPHLFRYPTFHMYLTSAVYGLDLLVGLLSGRYSSLADFRSAMLEDPAHFHLLGRGFTALLGSATVLVVYRLAALCAGRAAGLVAALFLALTYLHARDSHFATTDVPLTFFLTLAAYFAVRAGLDGRARWYLWSGLTAGLAAGTKYVGTLIAVPVAIGHALRQQQLGKRPWTELQKPALFALALGVAFAASSPFVLVEWRQVVADVTKEWNYLERGYEMVFARGYWHHLSFSLFHGLGPTQWLAALLGGGLLAVQRPRIAAVLFSFPLAYYFVIGRGYAVFVRYTIPLIPFLCVAAAAFVVEIAGRLSRSWSAPGRAALLVLLAAFTIAPSVVDLIRFDRLLTRTDTRLLTQAWVQANVPEGESIYQTGARWGMLQLPPSTDGILSLHRGPGNVRTRRALLRLAEARGTQGYDTWSLKGTAFAVNGRPTGSLPRFIVVQESPLRMYSAVPDGVRDLLDSRYKLLRSFAPNRWEADTLFDQQDAFYVPFTGFHGVERPGPNFHIYERGNGAPGPMARGAPSARRPPGASGD